MNTIAPLPLAALRLSPETIAALSQLGTPYVWAGSQPGGFDCSGLVMWAFSQVGVSLPHSSSAQYGSGLNHSQSAQ